MAEAVRLDSRANKRNLCAAAEAAAWTNEDAGNILLVLAAIMWRAAAVAAAGYSIFVSCIFTFSQFAVRQPHENNQLQQTEPDTETECATEALHEM